MFQFTREFIINDNQGKLTNATGQKVRFYNDGKVMYIDNMINIRKQDVHAIYKNSWKSAEVDVLEIPASSLTATGTLVRMMIVLGQRGRVISTFNDQYPDHSRHLFYETSDTTNVVDGLLKSVASEATLRGEKFLDITKNAAGDLVLTAPDCYTIIKEVRIVELPATSAVGKIGAIMTGYEDYDVILDWKRNDPSKTIQLSSESNEGVGNTVQILKNMRLLTDANLNPYGLNMDERPLPKGQYDQYTVEIVTERRHIGHDVMGSVGTSLTTLVFYVLAGGTCEATVSGEFEEELGKLCTIEDAVVEDTTTGTSIDHQEPTKKVQVYENEKEEMIATAVAEVEKSAEESTGEE